MSYRVILNLTFMTDWDTSGSLSRDRRQARQVGRDRRPIGVAEVSGGALDDPGHGPAGHVAVRPEAGLQVIGQVARAPAADAVLGIGRDVGHFLAVRPFRVAGELAVLVLGAQEIARRVALAAVAQVLDQIGTPVPLGVAGLPTPSATVT